MLEATDPLFVGKEYQLQKGEADFPFSVPSLRYVETKSKRASRISATISIPTNKSSRK